MRQWFRLDRPIAGISQNSLGLTLVEVLLATGITAIVGSLILAIFVNNTGVYYQQSSKIEQGLQLNNALASVRKNLTNAAAIAAAYPETGQPLYTSSTDQLVIKLPAIDSSNNIVANVYDYFIYTLNQGRLHLLIYPDPASSRHSQDQILALNVSNILFEYLDWSGLPVGINVASKVRLTVQVNQKAGAVNQQTIATTEANLKNL